MKWGENNLSTFLSLIQVKSELYNLIYKII